MEERINADRETRITSALEILTGSESFKEGQKEVILKIADRHDTVSVMPTGSGKSVCYQISALELGGTTLVISPLIALMEDQVKSFSEKSEKLSILYGRDVKVFCITGESIFDGNKFHRFHKKMTDEEAGQDEDSPSFRTLRNKIYEEALDKTKTCIIYISPERLRRGEFIHFAKQASISLIAVDEAHCISLWGYEYRPQYLEIARIIDRIGYKPVIAAFTASATKETIKDIECFLKLKLDQPGSSKEIKPRKNLHFSVVYPEKVKLWKLNKKNIVRRVTRGRPGEYGSEAHAVMGRLKKKAIRCRIEKKSADLKFLENYGEFKDRFELFSEFFKLAKLLEIVNSRKDDCGIVFCATKKQVDRVCGYLLNEKNNVSAVKYYSGLKEKDSNLEAFIKGRDKVMVASNALGLGLNKTDVRYVVHFNMPLSLENYYQEAGRGGRDGKDCDCILLYQPGDDEICKELIKHSTNASKLDKENKRTIRLCAAERLEKMKEYAECSNNTTPAGPEPEEDLQERILDYFDNFSFFPDDQKKQADVRKLRKSVLKMVNSIDVLYCNRTKIANQLSKGKMKDDNVRIGKERHSYEVIGTALDSYDILIADAVYTLIFHNAGKEGGHVITPKMVFDVMAKNFRLIRPERRKVISERIKNMMKAELVLNGENKGSFLPLEAVGDNGFMYSEVPPLWKYAEEKMNGEFYSFDRRILPEYSKDRRLTEERLLLYIYLLKRIDCMPKPAFGDYRRRNTGRFIRFDTVIEDFGWESNKDKDEKDVHSRELEYYKRKWLAFKDSLDQLKEKRLIASYCAKNGEPKSLADYRKASVLISFDPLDIAKKEPSKDIKEEPVKEKKKAQEQKLDLCRSKWENVRARLEELKENGLIVSYSDKPFRPKLKANRNRASITVSFTLDLSEKQED